MNPLQIKPNVPVKSKKALADVVEVVFGPAEPLVFRNIQMDWTETGACVFSSVPIHCPACEVLIAPNVEHLCGDRVPKPSKRFRAARGKTA